MMDPAMHHEAVFDTRSAVVEGVIVAIDDTGQAQTVDVQTHDGIVRSGIEVKQVFGLASRAPQAGGTVLLLAVGGDVGHYVALPLLNPSTRFGNLAEGDGGVLYAPDGSRVAVMHGGVVQMLGMAQVEVASPGVSISAPNGVTITGPTSITGSVTINGALSVSGPLSVTGQVSVQGNVTVSGTVTAANISG